MQKLQAKSAVIIDDLNRDHEFKILLLTLSLTHNYTPISHCYGQPATID